MYIVNKLMLLRLCLACSFICKRLIKICHNVLYNRSNNTKAIFPQPFPGRQESGRDHYWNVARSLLPRDVLPLGQFQGKLF